VNHRRKGANSSKARTVIESRRTVVESRRTVVEGRRTVVEAVVLSSRTPRTGAGPSKGWGEARNRVDPWNELAGAGAPVALFEW